MIYHIVFIDDLNPEGIQNRSSERLIHFLGVIPGNQTHLLGEGIVEIDQLAPCPQANGIFHGPAWDGFLKIMLPVDQTKSVITPRFLLSLRCGSPLKFWRRLH